MPNVLAKLGADILGINPNVSTAGVIGFDRAAHAARLGRARQVVGREPRGDARPRRGAADPRRRHRARARRRRGSAGHHLARLERRARWRDRRCPWTRASKSRRYAPPAGSEVLRTKLLGHRSCWRRPTRPGVRSRREHLRGLRLPVSSCPPSTPSPASVRLLSLLATRKRRCPGIVAGLPKSLHRPAGGADALRAEGPRHADPRRAGGPDQVWSSWTG